MDTILSQRYYELDDLYRAFDLGLQAAVVVLRSSQDLSKEGRLYLAEELEKMTADTFSSASREAGGHSQ